MWLSKKEYKNLTDKLDSLQNDCSELSRGIRSIDEKQKTLERRMKQIQGKKDKKGKQWRTRNYSMMLPDGTIMGPHEYNELVNDVLEVTSSYEISITNLETLFQNILIDVREQTIPF